MRPKSIIINKQDTVLEQILNELISALKKTFTEEDLLKFSYLILKESGKQTYKSKKRTTVKLLKSMGKISGKALLFTHKKVHHYIVNGFQNELKKDIKQTKHVLSKTPQKILVFGKHIKNKAIDFNKNFLQKTKDEKIEFISVGLMGVLIFFASAGGKDIEGGIPDLDLKLGIGYHRNIISHSIFMGIIVEFLMRTGIEIINKTYKNLPDNHHCFWDKTNDYMNKHKGIAIGAMWAGISAHLIKDSGFIMGGVKPYNGIPVKLSMTTHKSLFAANGVVSAMFARDSIKR